MEEVFEPVNVKQAEATKYQKKLCERQLQALRDSSQTTVQAIQDQTRAIRESSKAMNKNLQNRLKKEYKKMMKLLIVNINLLLT